MKKVLGVFICIGMMLGMSPIYMGTTVKAEAAITISFTSGNDFSDQGVTEDKIFTIAFSDFDRTPTGYTAYWCTEKGDVVGNNMPVPAI